MNIRAFFAVPIPDRIARVLADYSDALCVYDHGLDAHWVDSTSYHLTLCFLGDITLDQVQCLEQVARDTLEQTPGCRVPLDTLDYYPVNPQLALVAALSSEPAPLVALQQRLVRVVELCGIDYHSQGFRPHVTLGRLPVQNRFEVPATWPQLNELALATSVVLYQSRPGERGSIYTPLFEIPLSAPADSL